MRLPVGIAALGAVLAAAACATVLHGAEQRPDAVLVVPIAWAWGAWTCATVRRDLPPRVPLLLGAALGVRLVLIGTPPLLSDDLYRYLWEGLATAAGHDVFRVAPAALDGLDDALRARVNHPEVPSVYPPLALAWFRLLSLGGSVGWTQALTALVDALVPLGIRIAARREWPAWIYALHPLPALESAVSAHIDVPAVALGVAALALATSRRSDGAFAAAVAGGLVKLFPWLWAPVLLRGRSTGAAAVRVAAAAAVVLALAWPWLSGSAPAGPRTYAETWAFNGLVYPWLEPWLGSGARWPLVGVGGGVLLLVWWRVREPAVAWSALGTTFVALSPTVHPWYVLWALAPSLALGERRWAWASLPLLGSYLVLSAFDPATGTWSEARWLWWVTWPAALALWAAGARLDLADQAPRSEETPTAP